MEIQGYPNYLIYDDGRVQIKKTGRFMKQCPNTHGYKRVNLSRDGKKKTHDVHRLLGIHFIPNPENKGFIDHIDRCRTNNDVSNLRWATHSENGQNTGKMSTNTSGHKNISWDPVNYKWRYQKIINGKKKARNFKSKTHAICYKFGMKLIDLKG